MLPVIEIFGREIAMYGLLILIGCLLGVLAAYLRAGIYRTAGQDVLFAFLMGIVGVIIGAKLFYIVTILPQLAAVLQAGLSLTEVFGMLSAGFVFYGGLFGGGAAVFLYCRKYKLPFLNMLELILPSVPLIHSLGRIGCFCAGCCYGIPYEGAVGVRFPEAGIAPSGTDLFPVQLLESLLLFLLAASLFWYGRKKRKPGRILGFYCFGYGLIRLVTETFRGDQIRGFLWIFSTSQWISFLLIVAGILALMPGKNMRNNVKKI
ncbi:prolipoprotein diacylglyceryl transferase [Anaerolentibacter hominis]|uniref:prolipoprotein diacylglyceryl transferase n=1 Tax=Anaerolentibacter hominis TaxID=3079009 RepID=UPI0031B8764A